MRIKRNRAATAIVTSSTKEAETTHVVVEGFKQSHEDKTEDATKEEPEKNEIEMKCTLDERQIKLMMDLVEVPTYTGDTKKMRSFIRAKLHEIPDTMFWTHDGNIYVIRGEADLYPCVVAHTDTVHRNQKHIHCVRIGDKLCAIEGKKMEQTGTGGDDKVGILIALECIRKFKNIKVVFFRDEESGCRGSANANMDFFKNTTMVIQCDRRGRYDITEKINGLEMVTEEFKTAIKPLIETFKRNWVDGMMTDVLELAQKKLQVVCMNLSCGYYDPHTDRETINMLHMQETMAFVYELIEQFGDRQWLIPKRERKYVNYSPPVTGYSNYHGRSYNEGDYDGWDSSWGKWEKSKIKELPNPDDCYLRRDGTWVSKKTGEPIHKEVAGEDFRTSPKDFCENCGALLLGKKERDIMHCSKCVETISGNPISMY